MRRPYRITKKKSIWPKVIFIDWNSTLSSSKFWGHLENSEDNDLFFKWVDSMFIVHKDLIYPWMRGRISSENVLKKIAIDTGTDYKRVLREFIKGCEIMTFATTKISSLVQELRSNGSKVVIATNNMDSFTRWTVPAMKLNLLFDDVLNSFELKALKHDVGKNGKSLFFTSFFNRVKIEPSECIFIDDGEDKNNLINSLGIDYHRVPGDIGLQPELEKILGRG